MRTPALAGLIETAKEVGKRLAEDPSAVTGLSPVAVHGAR